MRVEDLSKEQFAAFALEIIRTTKLADYIPYGLPTTLCPDGELWQKNNATGLWDDWSNKPWQLNFHNAGKENQERALISANRAGKTHSAGSEIAYHATGNYPEWWDGKVFEKEVLIWCGSITNEASRDIVQKELVGGVGEILGTGAIPKDCIIGKPQMRQAGISDVIDFIRVRHKNGGVSTIVFKSYDQGWRKWQGTAPEVIWLDEEPDASTLNEARIYSEALTRILSSHGIILSTFTPLLGMTELVRHYMEGGTGIYIETAAWEDAPHLIKEERDRLAASYEDYERDTRTKGVPMMGEGRVFQVTEDSIKVDPFEIPNHYAQIWGIDFGLGHPFGAVLLAHDRETDTIYVVADYRVKDQLPPVHSAAIKAKGPWQPVSWPHDGLNREKKGGDKLKVAYSDAGLSMLSMSARYDNDTGGRQEEEPIITDILQRMVTGRWKVFSSCSYWLEEFRSYHRKNGILVANREDVLKASFYAMMMIRFAAPKIIRNVNRATPKALTV